MEKDNVGKNIYKAKNLLFFFSVLGTVLFIVGIPMIVLGAVKHITVVMVAGIVFTGGNFYAIPLLWTFFGTMCGRIKLYETITVKNVTDIPTLGRVFDKSEKVMYQSVQKLISDRYLVGYMLIDNHLAKITSKGSAIIDLTATVTALCPFCGGKVPMLDGKGLCPYCGSLVTQENANFYDATAPEHTK